MAVMIPVLTRHWKVGAEGISFPAIETGLPGAIP